MEKKVKGGKRRGSGAKVRADSVSVSRTIRFSELEWENVVAAAAREGVTPSEYVRQSVLRVGFDFSSI